MRKLATIRKIDNIRPIDGADAIELAIVDGWKVVVKKGEFSVGDLAIYLEIDSWVPHTIAPFLTKSGNYPKVFEGVEGQRLKTIRLRGQLSQGLLLPFTQEIADTLALQIKSVDEYVGVDVTDVLGVLKWEKPIAPQLAGQVRGSFPTAIPKTDQERVQNLKRQIVDWSDQRLKFEVTEKLEGSSCTMYLDCDGEFHVCSRNIDLKEDEGNNFWVVARKFDVENRLRDLALFGYAIQGELVGPGIQGNIYGFAQPTFYVYDVYSEHDGAYLTSLERQELTKKLGLKHVPVLQGCMDLYPADVDALLAVAEGVSHLAQTEREGIVFKCLTDPSISFKAISNRYLLKEK